MTLSYPNKTHAIVQKRAVKANAIIINKAAKGSFSPVLANQSVDARQCLLLVKHAGSLSVLRRLVPEY